MSTKLKTFIDMNRQQMDSFVPSSDVWLKINTGMQKTPVIKSNISWLRYFAYSTSVILALGFLYTLVNKNEPPSSPLPVTQAITAATSIPAAGKAEAAPPEPGQTNNDIHPATPSQPAQNDDITIAGSPAVTVSTLTELLLPDAKGVSEETNAAPTLQSTDPSGDKATVHSTKKDSLFADTTFSGINALELTVTSCDVNVKPSNTSLVHFKADITTKTRGIMIGKGGYRVVYEKQGSVLKIRLENESKYVLIAGDYKVHAVIDLNVPDSISLMINNAYGDVKMNGIRTEKCNLVTSSGELTVENGNGNIELNSSYGDVVISDFKGDVVVTASSGDVGISNLNGNLKITAAYGSIVLKSITGDATINAVSGNVNICAMFGNLDVISEYGDITLQDYKGTPKLYASSGDITGKNVELKEGMTTKSNYGSVSMSLLNDYADLSFDLSAEYGDISISKGGQQVKNKNKVFIKQGNILVKGHSESGDQTYR
ncbi:MAG: hypothetical protein JWP12_2839 [Bacteroidetes bacterium]|nr:hypothetical protein [Bacteroidota bacterium]